MKIVNSDKEYYKSDEHLHCYLLSQLIYELDKPFGLNSDGYLSRGQMIRYLKDLAIEIDTYGFCYKKNAYRSFAKCVVGNEYLFFDIFNILN